MGKLYVKIKKRIPIIDRTSADQVSQHLPASAAVVYQPKSHSRYRFRDMDGEAFIFGSHVVTSFWQGEQLGENVRN